MSIDDSEVELLPATDELGVDDDLTLAEGLIDPAQLDALDPEADDEGEPTPFGRGWAFDFDTGQFRRGGGGPLGVSGYDQLVMWVQKTMRTARSTHAIYTDNFGVDNPFDLIGKPFTSSGAGRYTEALRDALLAHDRISAVEDVTFDGSPDSSVVYVSLTIVTDEEESLEIEGLPLGGAP